MDSESLRPPLQWKTPLTSRLALGLLAVGVLAALLFLASYQGPEADLPTKAEGEDSLPRKERVAAPTSGEVEAPTSDTGATDSPSEVAVDQAVEDEPAQVESKALLAPRTAGGTNKQPAAAKRPSKPNGSNEIPTSDNDEEMFGKRY
jgi:hypothetical protein